MPKSIEAEGVTVDEAIQNALNALGLGRDSVEIEILHHPRSGFLGIGARRAKVRATLREQVMRDGEEFDMAPEGGGRGRRRRRSGRRRSPRAGEGRPVEGKQASPGGQPRRGSQTGSADAASSPSESAAVPQETAAGGEPMRTGRGSRRRGGRRSGRGTEAPRSGREDQQRSTSPGDTRRQGATAGQEGSPPRGEEGSAARREQRPDGARTSPAARRVDLDVLLRRAIEITERLVREMGFEARVTGTIDGGGLSLCVDADDGGAILIGRRGTTLDAIEHLIGRMTLGVEPGSRVRVAVDVCGYRDKRRSALEELAAKMKEHTVTLGRRAQITPLSPQDRSVFLDALSGDESVVTRALGTGFYRRVLVVPKGIPNDGSAPDDFGEDGNLLSVTGGADHEATLDEREPVGEADVAETEPDTDGDGDDGDDSPGAA